MKTLLLIRHGQASFDRGEQDCLSPLGLKQARRLGQWLAARRLAPAGVWCGPLRRQLETVHQLAESAIAAGHTLPPPVQLDELREMSPSTGMREALARRIDEQIVARQRQGGEATGMSDPSWRRELARKLLTQEIERWAAGAIEVEPEHSFAHFTACVQRGLSCIGDALPDGGCGLVITSAGPVAVAVATALELSGVQAMRLAATMIHAAVTEIRITNGELRLISYNSAHHIEQGDISDTNVT